MPNTLNNRVVFKMEKKYESNGLQVIVSHELDLTVVGAYYPPRTCEMNNKTTAPHNTLKVLEIDTCAFHIEITEPYLLSFSFLVSILTLFPFLDTIPVFSSDTFLVDFRYYTFRIISDRLLDLFRYYCLVTVLGPQVKCVIFLQEAGNLVENVENFLGWHCFKF